MLDFLEYLDVPYANPVVQTAEKIVEVQQVQFFERTVEVLQIQCQEAIRHMTVPQVQEVIRQVTVLPRWCLRLTRDPTEHEFVASDTRHGRNPSTMLSRNAPQTNQPDIMVGMDQKDSCVDDKSKNKRGMSKLTYPVENGTATS